MAATTNTRKPRAKPPSLSDKAAAREYADAGRRRVAHVPQAAREEYAKLTAARSARFRHWEGLTL